MFAPTCNSPLAKPVWLGAKVTVKFADCPAPIVAGNPDAFSEKALGAFVFITGSETVGVVAGMLVGLVSVNVIGLVEVKEVFGKFKGELLEGISTTGPVGD
jgi:hypothetical protein